jgi:hypothetical protein
MKYVFTLLSIVFLGFQANAQQELNLGSKITFSKSEHNFGQQPVGKPVTYDFEFTNTGNKPLILTEVKASCGCTTPGWTKEPVMPGQKGSVKVQYNMARENSFRKSVTVKTADGEIVTLYISGDAIQPNNGVEGAKPSLIGQ